MKTSTTDHILRRSPFGAMSTLAGLLLSVTGCMGAGSAHGTGQAVDRRTSALTIAGLDSANGTYGAGCTDRSGAWSVEIASGATLDNAPLDVVLNDVACVLTLTEVRADDVALTADPPIVLTASYQVTASSFDVPISFYANARLSSVAFAGDFVLTVLFSDDPALATDSNTASYQVIESSAVGQSVDAPDYTLDASGLALLTDANDVVQSAVGSAALTDGLVLGQNYVVVDASGLDTYAELDAAYAGGTEAAITATIPAAAFTLVGDDLTVSQVRTLIISNLESGVRSYQAFEITFHAAP